MPTTVVYTRIFFFRDSRHSLHMHYENFVPADKLKTQDVVKVLKTRDKNLQEQMKLDKGRILPLNQRIPVLPENRWILNVQLCSFFASDH